MLISYTVGCSSLGSLALWVSDSPLSQKHLPELPFFVFLGVFFSLWKEKFRAQLTY